MFVDFISVVELRLTLLEYRIDHSQQKKLRKRVNGLILIVKQRSNPPFPLTDTVGRLLCRGCRGAIPAKAVLAPIATVADKVAMPFIMAESYRETRKNDSIDGSGEVEVVKKTIGIDGFERMRNSSMND